LRLVGVAVGAVGAVSAGGSCGGLVAAATCSTRGEEGGEGEDEGRGDSDIAGCPASAAQTEWRQAALLAGWGGCGSSSSAHFAVRGEAGRWQQLRSPEPETTRGRGDSDIAGCPASAAQTEWRQAALLAGWGGCGSSSSAHLRWRERRWVLRWVSVAAGARSRWAW
jgi:hypothetical protein